MGLCLKFQYPGQIQLLSRILSCNFSAIASSTRVKPCLDTHQPIAIKHVISRAQLDVTERKTSRKTYKSQYSVPFVFPNHFDHERVVLCQAAEVTNMSGSDGSSSKEKPTGKPTNEQLEIVYLKLSEDIPRLFTTTQDFRIYDPNMVFEDNIRNKVVVGIQNYSINISLLKIKSHLKYTHVKMNVLRATQHPEEGTVKMRWRIVGSPGFFKLLTSFWKFKPISIYKNRTLSKDDAEWIDGFSIFYVNDQGKIIRHVCEKMMPDDDKVVEKKTKLNVAI